MLLEVASYDAIPADDINFALWDDALQPEEQEEEYDIGKFEDLGYDGPYVLTNLTSSLVILLVSLIGLLALIILSMEFCCCKCCGKLRGSFYGVMFWNFPIRFLKESFSVIAICCMLNMTSLSWNSRGEVRANTIIALILFALLCIYPIYMQIFLYRHREDL